MKVRPATADDAAACATIYAPYVLETAISFELEPPTPAQMAARIAAANERWAFLVAEDDRQVVGYAYATAFNERAAYRWACHHQRLPRPGPATAQRGAHCSTRRCSPGSPSGGFDGRWPE